MAARCGPGSPSQRVVTGERRPRRRSERSCAAALRNPNPRGNQVLRAQYSSIGNFRLPCFCLPKAPSTLVLTLGLISSTAEMPGSALPGVAVASFVRLPFSSAAVVSHRHFGLRPRATWQTLPAGGVQGRGRVDRDGRGPGSVGDRSATGLTWALGAIWDLWFATDQIAHTRPTRGTTVSGRLADAGRGFTRRCQAWPPISRRVLRRCRGRGPPSRLQRRTLGAITAPIWLFAHESDISEDPHPRMWE